MSYSTITSIVRDHQALLERCAKHLNVAEYYLSPARRPDATPENPFVHSHDLKAMHEHASVLTAMIQIISGRIAKLHSFNHSDTEPRARRIAFSTDLPGNQGVCSEFMEDYRARGLDQLFRRIEVLLERGHLAPRHVDRELERNISAIWALLAELQGQIDEALGIYATDHAHLKNLRDRIKGASTLDLSGLWTTVDAEITRTLRRQPACRNLRIGFAPAPAPVPVLPPMPAPVPAPVQVIPVVRRQAAHRNLRAVALAQ